MIQPLLVRALKQQPIDRPPVWMMRQAGRYLSEYQELKAKYSFLELCKSPELALKVSMQPMYALAPDAAIVFADILLPFEGMGIKIDFNPGPKVFNPVKSRADIEALIITDPHQTLQYVFDTISALKRELTSAEKTSPPKAVIGFAGAPWTMACYLLDQGPFKHFQGTQVFAATDEVGMKQVLEKLTILLTDYLLAQIESGADAVQLFDSWAGNLSLADYRKFALPYTARIIEKIKSTGCPIILYVNGSAHLLPAMLESGADCLSVDWRTTLPQAESLIGSSSAIQGNFDPCALFQERQAVVENTKQMLSQLKRRTGYIANLGHGILQRTPRENAQAFISTVQAGWPEL